MNIQDLRVKHYNFTALVDSEDLSLLEQLVLETMPDELLEVSGEYVVSFKGEIPKVTIHSAGIYNGLKCIDATRNLLKIIEAQIETQFDDGFWYEDYSQFGGF